MAELTQEQLLLLDNLMYLTDITYNNKYNTVGKLIEAYTDGRIELTENNLSGGFEKDEETIQRMKDVLTAIENDPELMAKEYIEGLGYTDITVTGHSKGGNLAMYTTVTCGNQVQSCRKRG